MGKRSKFRCRLTAWLALTSLGSISACAQTTGTWLGAGGIWSDPNLWTSKPQFPSNGGEANFISQINSTTTGTITLDTSVQLSRLITANTRYMQVIQATGGNTLELVGPAEVRVDDPLIWVSGFFWPRPGFWLKGGVSGTAGLTKTGAGAMVLSDTNSFTGGLCINGGTVFARGDQALGGAGQPITINGGTLSSFSNTAPLDTSRTINIGANGGTFHAYASVPIIRGDITGDSVLTFQGNLLQPDISTGLRVTADASFTGDIRVFTRAGNATSVGTLSETGAWRHARSLQVVGGLALDNSLIANSDRLSDGTVTLTSGSLTVSGNTTTSINEHAGVLVADGCGRLIVGNAGTQPVNLTFARLETRRGGGISVVDSGGPASIRFDQPPSLSGAGTFGTDSAPIAPQLSVNSLNTYDAATGVRRLTSSEYLTTFSAATSFTNVSIGTVMTVDTAVSVNALELKSSSYLNGNGTIAVTSGVIANDQNFRDFRPSIDFGSTRGIVSGRYLLYGSISGTEGLDLINGHLIIKAISNYTGPTSISSGTLALSSGDVLPGVPGPLGADSSAIQMLDSSLYCSSGVIGRDFILKSMPGTKNLISTMSGPLTVSGDISGTGTLSLESDSGTLSISGDISGPLKLNINHGSNVRLSGDNTFSIGIELFSSVQVIIASDSALGTGSIQTGRGTLLSAGGIRTLANPLVLSAAGVATFATGSQFVFTGPVQLDTDSRVYANAGANVRLNGAITGGGSFRALGPGALTIGRANTFDRTFEVGTASFVKIDAAASSATKIASLSIAGTPAAPLGTLDLADGDLIVAANSIGDVTSLIRFARRGGLWDRPGITSSSAGSAFPKNTTLGILSGSEYRLVYGSSAVFDAFAVADTDVLVKYTYYGDTDFNGLIDFDDYSRIDAGFNNNRTGWFNGDVDYNGIVDFDDYSLIDQAFNTQAGTLRRAMSYLDGGDRSNDGMNTPALRMIEQHFAQFGNRYATSFLNNVPEPASIGAMGLGLLLLPRRRVRSGMVRRRQLSA